MKKLVSILLTLAMMVTMFGCVLANPVGDPQATMVGGADEAIRKVLGAIKWVGYAFAIGMLIYIGIKYMMSAANEKADLKKGLINYVIGAILVAATATISGWIIEFAKFGSGS